MLKSKDNGNIFTEPWIQAATRLIPYYLKIEMCGVRTIEKVFKIDERAISKLMRNIQLCMNIHFENT
jgi:hypothetical protein